MDSAGRKKQVVAELAEEERRQLELSRKRRSELATPPMGEDPAVWERRLEDLVSRSSQSLPKPTATPPAAGTDPSLLALVSVMQQQMQMQQQQWQVAQREKRRNGAKKSRRS